MREIHELSGRVFTIREVLSWLSRKMMLMSYNYIFLVIAFCIACTTNGETINSSLCPDGKCDGQGEECSLGAIFDGEKNQFRVGPFDGEGRISVVVWGPDEGTATLRVSGEEKTIDFAVGNHAYLQPQEGCIELEANLSHPTSGLLTAREVK